MCVLSGLPAEDLLVGDTCPLQLAVWETIYGGQGQPWRRLMPSDSEAAAAAVGGGLRACQVRWTVTPKPDAVGVTVRHAAVDVAAATHQLVVTLTAKQAGQHQLRVWVRDVEVANSPFTIQVYDSLLLLFLIRSFLICSHYISLSLFR